MRSRCRGSKSIPGGGTRIPQALRRCQEKEGKKKKKQWFIDDFFSETLHPKIFWEKRITWLITLNKLNSSLLHTRNL